MDFKALGKALTLVGIVLAAAYLVLAVGYNTADVMHTEPALVVAVRIAFSLAIVITLAVAYFQYKWYDENIRTRQNQVIQRDGYLVTKESWETIQSNIDKWRNARSNPEEWHVEITSNSDGSEIHISVTH